MRLNPETIMLIRRVVSEFADEGARVRLFGSRTDDTKRGGDVDLLIECPHPVEHPVELATRIAGRLTRLLDGRPVDVLITAPNSSRQPVHERAAAEGILL